MPRYNQNNKDKPTKKKGTEKTELGRVNKTDYSLNDVSNKEKVYHTWMLTDPESAHKVDDLNNLFMSQLKWDVQDARFGELRQLCIEIVIREKMLDIATAADFRTEIKDGVTGNTVEMRSHYLLHQYHQFNGSILRKMLAFGLIIPPSKKAPEKSAGSGLELLWRGPPKNVRIIKELPKGDDEPEEKDAYAGLEGGS